MTVMESLECEHGVSMKYRVWGAEDRETLLIVHGLGSDHRQFIDDAAYFAERGYRCIVPDLRGHGLTNTPDPLTKETMTMATMARDLSRLIDKVAGGPVCLIGNSMGGVASLAMLGQHPEKASSLITFGTTYSLNFPPFAPWLQYAIAKVMGAKRLAETVAKSATEHENTRRIIREIYPDVDYRMVYMVQKTLRKYDYRKAAAKFPGPIMLIRAETDKDINKQLPATLKKLKKKPNFHLAELKGAGHFTNTDQPEAYRALVLDFLRGGG